MLNIVSIFQNVELRYIEMSDNIEISNSPIYRNIGLSDTSKYRIIRYIEISKSMRISYRTRFALPSPDVPVFFLRVIQILNDCFGRIKYRNRSRTYCCYFDFSLIVPVSCRNRCSCITSKYRFLVSSRTGFSVDIAHRYGVQLSAHSILVTKFQTKWRS